MRRLRISALLFGAVLLGGCPTPTTTDAGTTDSGSTTDSGTTTDAGTSTDAGTKLVPCLDQPSDLPRPPDAKGLPCELIPPGFPH